MSTEDVLNASITGENVSRSWLLRSSPMAMVPLQVSLVRTTGKSEESPKFLQMRAYQKCEIR